MPPRRTYEMNADHPVFTLAKLITRFEKGGAPAADVALARACIASLRRDKRTQDKREERARATPEGEVPAAAGDVFARLRDSAPEPVHLDAAERSNLRHLRRVGVRVQRVRHGYALPLVSPTNEVRP